MTKRDIKANPRDFFPYINGQKKNTQGIPPLKRRNGNGVTESELEQADEFKEKGSQKYTWILFKSICKTEQTAWKSDIYFWRYCDFMFSKWLPMEAAILKSTWKFKIMKLFSQKLAYTSTLTTAIFVYYVNNHFMGLLQE